MKTIEVNYIESPYEMVDVESDYYRAEREFYAEWSEDIKAEE